MDAVLKNVSFVIELVSVLIQLAALTDTVCYVCHPNWVRLITIHEFIAEKGLWIWDQVLKNTSIDSEIAANNFPFILFNGRECAWLDVQILDEAHCDTLFHLVRNHVVKNDCYACASHN